MAPTFIHLRLHTEYSLSDGLLTLPSLLAQVAHFKMPAVAITDHSNLFGAVKFYKEAISLGIKPIIGVDVYFLPDHKKPTQPALLTLLCQNKTGYHNLLRLISRAYLEGQTTGKPIIEKQWLETQAEGLIAISGQMGDVGQALLGHEIEAAKSCHQYWRQLFTDRFYFEASRVGKPDEQRYLHAIVKLAAETGTPLVATNDVRFLTRDDFEAHEARVCIKESQILNDPDRPRLYTDEQYLRSPEEMCTLFKDIPSALENSVEIAKRCNVHFELGQVLLPHFDVPAGYQTESYLSELAEKGLERRLKTIFSDTAPDLPTKRQPYIERLERELGVINKMGFAGYYLIVADFTKWAKENGIPVGPGRGSGPGSLVAYALNITDLDPIALDLLFERFLNPERISMPDFDIDFCMDGRDRVIDYVMQKHGQESVSQIITYGTMAAKAVVRDVGRILGLGYGFVDKIAKLIPFELGITLDKALQQEPQLFERYQQEEEVRTLIDLARKLEGLTRNVGKHAGGIVIAPGKIADLVPLYCEPNESAHPVTQFDKDDVETVGLVKFDFLGLKTLTIIDRTLQIIHAKRAVANESAIDINLIPLNDTDTFSLLKACRSTAVFQLESHGMRDLIKRLQPDCFEDLIALVALFRPGPLQAGMVDDFINRKNGLAKVIYPHPKLEPILRPTYGVIVYQEQVMQIAQVLAGYTLGAADILRKAMGKKKPEEMSKQREIFCNGAVSNGVHLSLATAIFDLMEKFAGYGFNKSHSAAYALLAYQTAWLKTHHLAAFMAAVLSSDMDKTEKILLFLEECKAFHLKVEPPNINDSHYNFTMQKEDQLFYGLGAIKGVGQAAIENVIAARDKNGAFKNLFDFCERIDLRKANRRVVEALIKSGCFDQLGTDRATLLASVDKALSDAEQALHNQTYGQRDLLSMHTEMSAVDYVKVAPWTEDERLLGEKETLGFYLTGHPLNRYRAELSYLTTCEIAKLPTNEYKTARVAGIITQIRTRQTKRGDKIAIFTLDGGKQALLETVCFAECYQKYGKLIVADQVVIAEGEIGVDDFSQKPRLICKELISIEEARAKLAKYLHITMPQQQALDPKQLQSVLIGYLGGVCPIKILLHHEDVATEITLGKKWHVKPQDSLVTQLMETLPAAKVEWVY